MIDRSYGIQEGGGGGGGEVRGDGVTDNRVQFYYFSVFESKKRLRSLKNPSVQCDFRSEILQKHKTLITID